MNDGVLEGGKIGVTQAWRPSARGTCRDRRFWKLAQPGRHPPRRRGAVQGLTCCSPLARGPGPGHLQTRPPAEGTAGPGQLRRRELEAGPPLPGRPDLEPSPGGRAGPPGGTPRPPPATAPGPRLPLCLLTEEPPSWPVGRSPACSRGRAQFSLSLLICKLGAAVLIQGCCQDWKGLCTSAFPGARRLVAAKENDNRRRLYLRYCLPPQTTLLYSFLLFRFSLPLTRGYFSVDY